MLINDRAKTAQKNMPISKIYRFFSLKNNSHQGSPKNGAKSHQSVQ